MNKDMGYLAANYANYANFYHRSDSTFVMVDEFVCLECRSDDHIAIAACTPFRRDVGATSRRDWLVHQARTAHLLIRLATSTYM